MLEKISPRKGTETDYYFLGGSILALEKISPRKGTETGLNRLIPLVECLLEKISPRKGTETLHLLEGEITYQLEKISPRKGTRVYDFHILCIMVKSLYRGH